jgi:hypothetical protein
MQTKIIAGVARLVLVVAVFIGMATAQAQGVDRTDEYNAAIASIEHFNEVQREADLPIMKIPTFEEWSAMQDAALTASTSIQAALAIDRAGQLRQWTNPGVLANDAPMTVSEIKAVRRQRLWARSFDAMQRRRIDLEVAREIISANDMAEYARIPDVGVIGLVGLDGGVPRYNITYNVGAADTISVDEVWPGGSTGFNLTGTNMTLGIWDGGDVLTNHHEFVQGSGARVINKDGISPLPVDPHPTAVAGTMVAGGNIPDLPWANARGMAFKSSLWAYDWFDDIDSEMNSAYANDVRVSNHSYGRQAGWGFVVIGTNVFLAWWGDVAISDQESHYFGWYDEDCHMVDDVAYGNPYSLPVWAAGNDRNDAAPSPGTPHIAFSNDAPFVSTATRPDDFYKSGFDTIPDKGIAKNVLTVGATFKISGGYSGTQSVSIAEFSGFGPTDDGRIKPDIVAAGVDLTTPIRNPDAPNNPFWHVTSTGNTNSPSYATGTSFSSPSIAGAVGLLGQLREQHIPGRPYWASTLKGLLLHAADPVGSPGPNYRTGWGLANAERAAVLMQDDYDDGGKQYIKEVMLNDGDYIEFPVVASGGEPLMVTICWTDPAGPVQPEQLNPTNLVLVNDLDLRIVSSGGATNMPWVLDPANPGNAATTGDNYRDNVEQVVVANTVGSDVYTVVITHKGVLVDDIGQPAAQGISIILSGIEPEAREELRIADFHVSTDDELVNWASVVGQNYQVETAIDLMNQGWTNVSVEISATKTNTTWVADPSSGEELRFFRLIKTN